MELAAFLHLVGRSRSLFASLCVDFFPPWFSKDMDINGHPGGRGGTMQTVPDKVDMSLGKNER